MTQLQKMHIEKIGALATAIFSVAKNVNIAETESIKTLAEFIGEEVEKINSETE